MLISKEWLSEFVDLSGKRDSDIARDFTLRVAEVEGVIDEGASFDRMCVGVISDVLPHPKADRLRITIVDVGEEKPLTIVCGGSNLSVGQKVAIARVGARVQWHGEGDLITLESTEIRGIVSDGMICGADEIGLGDLFPKKDEKEILDLSFCEAGAGTPLARALGKDAVLFELDNKALSNRPDLWGLRGLAREFGVVCGVEVTLHDPAPVVEGNEAQLVAHVETDTCIRYQAVVVSGLSGGTPSPEWMQVRLRASGVRPINAIVDVTNYVMLEGGQPLHAFDYKKVSSGIVVRNAREGENIEALDDKTYELDTSATVISTRDGEVIAVAGVIGGKKHSVSDTTESIVIESACFKASSVRKTSTKIHVRTESSSRFEKTIDPHLAPWGMARAVELLKRIFPEACVVSNIVDIHGELPQERVLQMTQNDIDRMVGGGVTLQDAEEILSKLGFGIARAAQGLQITVPTYRLKDVSGVHDLVEEVVRLYGYERLPSSLPHMSMRTISSDPMIEAQQLSKQIAVFRHGFTEVATYAYVKPQSALLFGFTPETLLELANPLSSERPFLAPTLVINACELIEKNQRAREEVMICEIAKVFRSGELVQDVSGKSDRAILQQPTHMVFAMSGKKEAHQFGIVRDAVLDVVRALGRHATIRPLSSQIAWAVPHAGGDIIIGETVVGYVTALHPLVEQKMGIERPTVVAELYLDAVIGMPRVKEVYREPFVYQGSERDIAMIVDESVSSEIITSSIISAHPYVRQARVFDVFRNEKIGSHKKAVAVHVLYRADDHTLSGEELDEIHKLVTGVLEKNIGAVIR